MRGNGDRIDKSQKQARVTALYRKPGLKIPGTDLADEPECGAFVALQSEHFAHWPDGGIALDMPDRLEDDTPREPICSAEIHMAPAFGERFDEPDDLVVR
jgi:hypothetical protein